MARSSRRPSSLATLVAATVIALTASGAASGAAASTGGRVADDLTPSGGSPELAPLAAPKAVGFDPTKVNVGISLVKSGFVDPVLVTNAGDGSGRLFVVEQAGRIRIIDGGPSSRRRSSTCAARSRAAASRACSAWPSTRTSRRIRSST